MTTNKIDFIDLKTQYNGLKDLINARIQRVLDHGQYIMGPEVRELEERLEEFTGAKHCISVSSGTDALLISLMAIGIKPGDEIITTPFTFIATVEVIALLGAIPVFVDIQQDTCNIDSSLIEAAITDKTKAIIPVSLYGQVADMHEINAIAERYNLIVIEDAAQSFGASYHGKKSCNLSKIGCTSFFPSKPLGCYGDGGAIFTSDDELAKIMREIRVHGQEKRYYHTRIGVGGRMDTLQCAILLAKLERFDWEVNRRIEVAKEYFKLLKNVNNIVTTSLHNNRSSVWAQFTVLIDNRERVQKMLNDFNIPTTIHYPVPLHKQPAYQQIAKLPKTLPQAELIAGRVMSLPMHPYLEVDTQIEIINTLNKSVNLNNSH